MAALATRNRNAAVDSAVAAVAAYLRDGQVYRIGARLARLAERAEHKEAVGRQKLVCKRKQTQTVSSDV